MNHVELALRLVSDGYGSYTVEKMTQQQLGEDAGHKPLSWSSVEDPAAFFRLMFINNVNMVFTKQVNKDKTSRLQAAEANHLAAVPLLSEKIIDPETRLGFCRKLLSHAAEHGHLAVIKLLLERGVDTEAKDSFCRTPLSYAAEKVI
ncbi:hypothetical protein XA68_11473 [Ophiocordyceps unilateralis]|uniref:Uncharacterized protein n=1 Tax=Ophiocordyceps unilateralis TaxID=268505 RepID=A0A2A9PF13_OPHUN|nr:hypothetical protein XA68_11473 [Ophiocordyceps unilateralis]